MNIMTNFRMDLSAFCQNPHGANEEFKEWVVPRDYISNITFDKSTEEIVKGQDLTKGLNKIA